MNKKFPAATKKVRKDICATGSRLVSCRREIYCPPKPQSLAATTEFKSQALIQFFRLFSIRCTNISREFILFVAKVKEEWEVGEKLKQEFHLIGRKFYHKRKVFVDFGIESHRVLVLKL